jgi:hypothetical protein
MVAVSGNRHARLLAAALTASISGCGLSAYEAKMAEAQKRADEIERTESALGIVITPPDGCPVDVYLRTPRGVAGSSSESLVNDYFYRYPSAGSGKGIVSQLYLAAAADGNLLTVRQRIRSSFPTAEALPARTVESADQRSLSFEAWTDSDFSTKNYIFLHQNGSNVVALVFRVAREKAGPEAESAIETSLRTLALGADAARARGAR